MIVSPNGSQMTQGQSVLVWGASGGIGAYACQYVMNGGGHPIAVVSSEKRVALLHEMGVEAVIDRRAEGYNFWKSERSRTRASGGDSARRSASSTSAVTSTSCSSTPGVRRWARRCSSPSAAG